MKTLFVALLAAYTLIGVTHVSGSCSIPNCNKCTTDPAICDNCYDGFGIFYHRPLGSLSA